MKLAAVALLVASGCRSIIGIEEADVDERLSNDEDGDTILDHRDNCPTIANLTQDDVDGDDVGDLCDPDQGAQNRIAFYSPILSDDGLFIGNSAAIGDGYAAIRGSQVVVGAPQTPTRVEAEVAFRTFAPAQTLTLELDAGAKGVWQCYAGFLISGCGGVDCLRFQAPTTSLMSTNFDEAEGLAKLTLDITPTGTTTCTATTVSGFQRTLTAFGIGKSLGTITVSATGDAELHSIIAYE
jgi:hypothetical protein